MVFSKIENGRLFVEGVEIGTVTGIDFATKRDKTAVWLVGHRDFSTFIFEGRRDRGGNSHQRRLHRRSNRRFLEAKSLVIEPVRSIIAACVWETALAIQEENERVLDDVLDSFE